MTDDVFAHVEREFEDMHAYQVEDAEFLWRNPYSYALLDLGLGKSVVGGTVARRLILDNLDQQILIVGPIAVVATSWPDELRSWRHLAPLSFVVLREDDDDPRIKAAMRHDRKTGERTQTIVRTRIRHELARSRASIHLVNFEALEWLTEFWGVRWPYRTVIVDEAHGLKSHDSGRFKALAKMRNTPGFITRMHLFTATPASESYMGFFAMTYLLDKGERFGQEITKFRNHYFIQNPYDMSFKLRPGAKEEILGKLAKIATIRKRADHFDTKDAMILQRRFNMNIHAQALYDQMEDDFVIKLGASEITADTAAAVSQKLSQMASGVVYETTLMEPPDYDPDIDDEIPDLIKVKKVHAIHDHKLEMLKAIVEELDGQNLIVSYQHRSSLARLIKAFPKGVKWDKTGKSKAAWNRGEIPMMFMHPKSGGAGQNLQKGGHVIVFFDIPWSREQFVQLVGRLDRQGQTEPVTVIMIVATGTIDEKIAKAQALKKMNEEEMFAILKSYIAALRKRRA